jgi:glycosyltransferase involved in cell wall biosynthesis
MKVYLDNIVFSLQKAGGISVYFTELISRMLLNNVDVEFIEQTKSRFNIFRNTLSLPPDRIRKELILPLSLMRYLPVGIKNSNRAIFHSSYYRTCNNSNISTIVTVYDFIYEHFRSGLSKYVHCKQKKRAISNADGIICLSENTKNDLIKFYGYIDQSKIKVIHLAASNDFYQLNDHDCTDLNNIYPSITKYKYIMYIGFRTPYKNFDVAVETVQKLAGYTLVVVGGASLSKDELLLLEKRLPGRHLYLSGVDNTLLNILYNFAFCLLYPSSYEGFGIPILEAMQAGCPVVTTNKSSIPEVCGEAGLMAEDICSDELARLIRLLESMSFREQAIRLGLEQARKFSWDKTYHETMAFYEEVFAKSLIHHRDVGCQLYHLTDK